MTRYKLYLMMGCFLILAAIVFILFYAINHPQASFPWSNSVTYAIYAAYGLLTGFDLGIGFQTQTYAHKMSRNC